MDTNNYSAVTCPCCFETFNVLAPDLSELPTNWDYDCEICCRPMRIHFYLDCEEVIAEAESER
jgi:hypothetical protein